MTKLAIIRSSPSKLDLNKYNVQEIGLAKGLASLGISTDIYTRVLGNSTDKIIYKNNSVIIKVIPISGIVFFKRVVFFPGLLSKILKGCYSIVQVHEYSMIANVWLLWKLKDNKLKKILYQGLYKDFKGINRIYQILFDFFLKRIIISYSDHILVKTRLAMDYLEQKGFRNISILRVGLDFNKNENESSNKKILELFKRKYEKVILYVGKIEKHRNPIFIIDVFSDLRNHQELNIGLIMVGDGMMAQLVQEYSILKNANQDILFLRSVLNSEIREVYKNSDLFLLPSENEIYGMVVLESIYYGLPVVSAPTAGPLDIIKNENLGICLPLNKELWVSNIIQILLKNENSTVKEQRKNYIINNYNWNQIAKEYFEILQINENTPN